MMAKFSEFYIMCWLFTNVYMGIHIDHLPIINKLNTTIPAGLNQTGSLLKTALQKNLSRSIIKC